MSAHPIDDLSAEQISAAQAFAFSMFEQVPKTDRAEFEAHITSALILFWGALWGTFGTEYAKGFIQAQLAGMEGEADIFTRTQQ